MRKRLFTALLAALLIASFAALPACSGDPQEPASSEGAMTTPSTGEVTAGEESTSPSDVTGQETQTQAESNGTTGNTTKAPAGNTTRRTTARTTKRTNQSGGDLIYTIPEDKNEIFPSNWTPTSKVTDIPANLKANVKSGKVNILTAAKMSEDERTEVSATFKKLTGQNLELTETVVDWLSLSSTLQTMVMAKNAPDVFYIYNGVAHYLRNKGLTRNINDYINMNDAVWKSQQDLSKVMYYDKKLTGAVVDTSLAGNGFSYDKRYLDGLTDPYTLYQQGKWDINTFMEYAEELTKRSGNTTTRYGVSCTTACILRMGLAMGKDIVEINDDGSYSSNLNSNVWTRYAGYARRINDFGSIDPYTVTDSKFGTGRVVLKESAWYANSLNENTIALKKAGQVGWVCHFLDSHHQLQFQGGYAPTGNGDGF